MSRSRNTNPAQMNLLEAPVNTAPCVPALRDAVKQWREGGYKGITETTRLLLDFWFRNDHRLPNGRRFAYHYAQREAIETLIFLYEARGIRRQKDLLQTFANRDDLRLLQYDLFPRYCIKMATGSGKTKVMALAIVWQFLNAVAEGCDDYASTFLLLAPNVIVFERLRSDFGSGRIFQTDPLIPPELKIYWDFDCYMRGESERATTQGALYLTNIQQFHERGGTQDDEPDPMTAVLGSKPPTKKIEVEDFDKRIATRAGHCMVLNDEAHHTHDEESEWSKVIRQIHESLTADSPRPNLGEGQGVRAGIIQLDMTATPRHSRGALFSWTIYDYPLKQAILDNIVKRPVKGLAAGIQERPSDHASVRYQAYLTAGVMRWREYCEQLAPLQKKPLLFVMLNDTTEADDVADYLRTKYPDAFDGDKLLVIHTDRSGEVSKKDLDIARALAREVDREASPVNALVSVLMLREGWDVQNVTVIVGLRPYTSKANILPEQTIGRGLRLMFRDEGNTYIERVDVIGNRKFIEFVEQLEKEEDIELGTFEIGKDKLQIVTILPDPEKAAKDITLPELSPLLTRKKTLAEEIAALDVMTWNTPVLPIRANDEAAKQFRYEGYDLITLEKIVEATYTIPEAQTAQEVISYYAKRIAQDVKLPSQFAALAPKVREFLERKAFGQTVSLDGAAMVKAISTNVAQYVTVKSFTAALRNLVVEELTPQLVSAGRALSITSPFPFSRPTLDAGKTVFNLVACDNEFERRFAQFLQDAEDVEAFAKLPQRFGFSIDYTDAASNLRYYEPDFVARLTGGTFWLIETKGREDIDVAHKDRAARIWCENATLLTEQSWNYLKVPQAEFESLRPDEFADVIVLLPVTLL